MYHIVSSLPTIPSPLSLPILSGHHTCPSSLPILSTYPPCLSLLLIFPTNPTDSFSRPNSYCPSLHITSCISASLAFSSFLSPSPSYPCLPACLSFLTTLPLPAIISLPSIRYPHFSLPIYLLPIHYVAAGLPHPSTHDHSSPTLDTCLFSYPSLMLLPLCSSVPFLIIPLCRSVLTPVPTRVDTSSSHPSTNLELDETCSEVTGLCNTAQE